MAQENTPVKNAPVKQAKPVKKEKKDGKPGFWARIAQWFRDIRGELKLVRKPTGKEVLKQTGIVIAVVLVFMVAIVGIDLLVQIFYKLLVGAL